MQDEVQVNDDDSIDRQFVHALARPLMQELAEHAQATVSLSTRDYQERGFCMSSGEWQGDVHAVGVPVAGIGGEQLMAFNCNGPSYLLPREHLEDDVDPRLVRLVRQINGNLGQEN